VADSSFNTAQRPPLCQGVEQVESLTALGVTFNSRFAVSEHVTKVLSSCSGLLYALCILRTHGMPAISLYDVFRATIVTKLLYCSPAWSGFCSAADISRLDAFLKRCKRYCYFPDHFPTVSELFCVLFSYNLRDGAHNYTLINNDSHINDRHFIVSLVYKHAC